MRPWSALRPRCRVSVQPCPVRLIKLNEHQASLKEIARQLAELHLTGEVPSETELATRQGAAGLWLEAAAPGMAGPARHRGGKEVL